jgi:hypothetical protein
MLEEREGKYAEALSYMELWKKCSADPARVQERIDAVRQELSRSKSPTSDNPQKARFAD